MMFNLQNLFSGQLVLEEVDSPINGKLTVVRDLTMGTYIKGGGLPQSGGLAEKIWQTTLDKISHQLLAINHCLILGLGGGSIAQLVKRFWKDAQITGVDIDPIMVELGKKYLGLSEKSVRIIISDGNKFVINHQPLDIGYDLICVDTYIGDKFPKKFENYKFLQKVGSLLREDGIAVFNRLYGKDDRAVADRFGRKLEKVFSKVEPVYPEANIMFVSHK